MPAEVRDEAAPVVHAMSPRFLIASKESVAVANVAPCILLRVAGIEDEVSTNIVSTTVSMVVRSPGMVVEVSTWIATTAAEIAPISAGTTAL
jgi:hypothetical protein